MTKKQAKQPVNVFCSYADQDEQLQKELVKHLQTLIQEKSIEIWDRSQVAPGMQVELEIRRALESAQLFLILISSDYLFEQGKYHSIEREQAMKRCAGGDVPVIPIILRSVDWTDAPFAHLQALPTNANPIIKWPDLDEAFVDIVKGVRRTVEVLTRRNKASGDDHERPNRPERYRDRFDNLIETHTRLFAGREEIIDKIHKYIEENPSGYIFIEGLSGYGKTSLLAKIVQNHPEFAYHFISQAYYRIDGSAFHPTESEWLVRNLCQQLGQGNSEDFISLRNPRDRFHHLLRTPSLDKAKVIIIDGVDEMDIYPDYPHGLKGLLPPKLPLGVFLIFSARTLGDKNYLAEVGLTPRDIQHRICLPGLDATAIQQLLSQAGEQATQYSRNEPFIQGLFSVSEGDPFYLRFLVEDVAGGIVRPDNLDSIPSGLEAYLDEQFKILARNADSLLQKRAILDIVITAYGPLEQDELIHMANKYLIEEYKRYGLQLKGPELLDGFKFDEVIRDIRRFLLENNGMFTFCHKRFKEYFNEKKLKGKREN